MSDGYYASITCRHKDKYGNTGGGLIHNIPLEDIRALNGLTKTIKEIKESIELIERFLGDDYKKLKEEETKLVEKDE